MFLIFTNVVREWITVYVGLLWYGIVYEGSYSVLLSAGFMEYREYGVLPRLYGVLRVHPLMGISATTLDNESKSYRSVYPS